MTTSCCGNNTHNEKNGGNNMMPEMAKKMMSNMENKSFSPIEMCEKMTKSIEQTAKLAGQANNEVQMLFEEWAGEVERELLELLKDQNESELCDFDVKKISSQLQVSEDSVLFFLNRLIKTKKVEVVNLKIR